MNEELKIIYGIIGLLLASGLLTYLTRNPNPASIDEPVREKKHNKKRQAKPELQLLGGQDTSRFLEEDARPHAPASEH